MVNKLTNINAKNNPFSSNHLRHMITTYSDRNPGHGLGQANNCGTHIGCVMVSVPASIAVDRGLEPQLDQTKDNKIDICCFSVK